MKKTTVFILLFILLFALCAPTMYAEGGASMRLDSCEASPGAEISVPLRLVGNPGILSIELNVVYDTNVLEWTGVQAGDFGGTIGDYELGIGQSVAWFARDERMDIEDDGVFVTLSFRVKEDTQVQETQISVTYSEDDIFNADLNNVHFDIVPGTITIQSQPTPIFTVTYDANGGMNAPASQTKAQGEALTLSSNEPNRTDSPAGSFTVTLDPNGGTVNTSSLTATRTSSYSFKNWNTRSDGSGTGYDPGESYTADADATLFAQWSVSTSTEAVALPTPVWAGHTFKGWAADSGADSGVTGSYTPQGNVTLVALWEEIPTFTVAYDANGGRNAPASQTKTQGTALTLSSDRPTHADSSAGSYTVTLNANGGSVSPASLTAARMTSYSFTRWNTKADGSGTSYSPGAVYNADEDAALFAQWSSSTSTASVSLPTPTWSGHTFKGWATDRDADTGITGTCTPSGDMTLYALWEQNPSTYTVFYDANGGIGAPASQTKTQGLNLVLSTGVPTRTNTVTLDYGTSSVETRRISATFDSWNTSRDGTGTRYASGAVYSKDAAIILYARWTDSTLGALPTPTRENYSFLGWYTASDGGTQVTANTAVTADMTIYARWIENGAPVRVSVSGGTMTISGTGALSDEDRQTIAAYKDAGITRIVVNRGITDLGDAAFRGFASLLSVSLPDGLASIGEHAFHGCKNLNSIEIPGSVVSIGNYAFSNCESLTGIMIPDGVSSIGSYAFWYCSSLADVSIPDSVTSIGAYAFNQCFFSRFTIPENVTEIGDGAFGNCMRLGSIHIPGKVVSIGNGAFYGCTSLSGITVSAQNPCYISADGILYNKEMTVIIRVPSNTAQTSFAIPDGVRTIGYGAFQHCRKLTRVTIPDSVTTIEFGAFDVCTMLEGVVIPDYVTSIGAQAFMDCESMAAINIPYGVKRIEDSTFAFCKSLTEIVIPYGITSIGPSAFTNCSNLITVTMPNTVTSISSYAFNKCGSLTDVFYEGSAEKWNAMQVGQGNDYLFSAEIHCRSALIEPDLILPAMLTEIEAEAFMGSGFVCVEIPEQVERIGAHAFANCPNLRLIIFDNGNIDVAEDFISGCSTELVIDAPEGSTVASNISLYLSYLCPPEPVTGRIR